jgi:hypothetical protein
MHKEGFVVEFLPHEPRHWTGNFQRGISELDVVFSHNSGNQHIVIAGGNAYLIETESGALAESFGGGIEWARHIAAPQGILYSNGVEFVLRRGVEIVWKSNRISWDGIRNLNVDDAMLRGEGRHYDDSWHAFNINLQTGLTTGGAYC